MLPKPSKSVHSDVLEEPNFEVTPLHPDPAGDSGANVALCCLACHLSGGRNSIYT